MRYAFHLTIAKGKEKMYDERHKNVWQDLLSTLKNAGVKNYSIFRDGTDIFGYWECDNLSGTLSSINKNWRVNQGETPLSFLLLFSFLMGSG